MASKATKPPRPARVPRGRAFATIQIPTIDVERVVVEGVGRDDLRKAPATCRARCCRRAGELRRIWPPDHLRGAVYRLDELRKGDRILVVTKGWLFASP